MFGKLFASIVPRVKAQEEQEVEEVELVDPQTELREKCNQKPKIEALFTRYQGCNDRVNSRTKTTEICSEELIDYLHELDHCVAHSLFTKLK